MGEPEEELGMRARAWRRVTSWLRSLRKPKRAMIASVVVATFVMILLGIFVGGGLRLLDVFIVTTEVIVWRRIHNKGYVHIPPKSELVPDVRIQRRLIPGEKPVRLWRKHPAALFLEGGIHIPAIVAAVISVISDVFAYRSLGGLIVLFILWFIIVMFLKALVKLPKWLAEKYCLTPHRIIMTQGIISHSEPQVNLKRFVDRKPVTPWHSHLLHFLGIIRVPYGTVQQETAGPNKDTMESLDNITFTPNVDALCLELSMLEYGGKTPADDHDGT